MFIVYLKYQRRLEFMTLFMRDEEKKEEGLMEGREETIQRMLKKGFSKDSILNLGYSEEEFSRAEQRMLTTV